MFTQKQIVIVSLRDIALSDFLSDLSITQYQLRPMLHCDSGSIPANTIEMLNQCWVKVGPASQTLNQR